MEYQVPQFIEVEDKIVGPLTLRQFIYLAGAAGMCIVFFFYLPLIVAVLLGAPVAALGAGLAFYKVNGKSLIDVAEAAFNYYIGAKLFLWKHEDKTPSAVRAQNAADAAAQAALPQRGTPRLTGGKLSELAWSLDVQKPNSGEK